MLREQIKKDIAEVISILNRDLKEEDVEVVRTSDSSHGDFATNVALKLGPKIKQKPLEFAKVLTDSLKNQPYVEKLQVAGPGFINIFCKNSYWQEEVEKLLKKPDVDLGVDTRKIIIEFTDPNPFKEFHIGHLYSNVVGESISRILAACGAEVKRANYQGDVGMHVAKSVWGMKKKLEAKKLEELEKATLEERVRFLGEAYALGAAAFGESEEAKKEITDLNKKIFEQDPEVMDLYIKGRAWSLEYFEKIYERLGTKFNFYYFEGTVGEVGAKMVRDNLGKVFVESEGAIIFPGEKYGLHSRVFVNSLGLPTYEAKELGLAPTKYKDFKYDYSIIITGNEIDDYFRVLLKALSLIESELAEKTKHVSHGMVRMPEGKMSSRTGKVVLGEWLMDEAKTQAKKIIAEKGRVEDIEGLSEEVGLGAIKYALLKGNIGQDVNFSFSESVSFEGNSGPYLQYTHARCHSVLAKAGKVDFAGANFNECEEVERKVLADLGVFGDVVFEAASNLSPNTIASYLYSLAADFNLFYNNLSILNSSETEKKRRLFLTKATADLLKKGLGLLGISAPGKM